MAPANLEEALNAWKSQYDGKDKVDITPQHIGGRLCYELSWNNPDGLKGYIDLYPQFNDVLVVQYGTYDPARNDRNHAGMTKFRCTSDLPARLSRVRATVEESELMDMSYSPAPRIGRVDSLKLR